MRLAPFETAAGLREARPFPDEEIVELALLLSAGQAAALEAAARRRGLTAGQLARRLIRDFLDRHGGPCSPESGPTDYRHLGAGPGTPPRRGASLLAEG